MKNIVVTGGTKGLGRAIAEHFAANGFNVAVCARTESDLHAAEAYWKEHFPNSELLAFPADVSKKSEVVEFGAFIRSKWDHLDVLVNNAGLFIPGMVTKEQEGTLETLIETNLYSAYHITRGLLPLLNAGSHIFNMCSVASIMAYPNGGSYSIAKFALLGLSKALREELKPAGIKVTALLPGATWSESWHGVDLPYERLMQAEDIARTVWGAYNLSPSAVVEEILIRPQLGDL
jgi:NAD(P)-dependent dehydrogenase (short-subunit alcohol dehydrogenase family)